MLWNQHFQVTSEDFDRTDATGSRSDQSSPQRNKEEPKKEEETYKFENPETESYVKCWAKMEDTSSGSSYVANAKGEVMPIHKLFLFKYHGP